MYPRLVLNHYIAEVGLELLILLSVSPKNWDHRQRLTHLVSVVLGTEVLAF